METKYHSNSLHQVLPASNQPNAQQQQKEIIQCSIEVHGLNLLSNFRLQVFHKIRISDWECDFFFFVRMIYGLDFFFLSFVFFVFKFINFAAINVLFICIPSTCINDQYVWHLSSYFYPLFIQTPETMIFKYIPIHNCLCEKYST